MGHETATKKVIQTIKFSTDLSRMQSNPELLIPKQTEEEKKIVEEWQQKVCIAILV